MEAFQTEEQQVEAIKSFWQENGNSLIAGLVLGLGGFIGWNYYQDSQLESQYVASYEYQQTMESFASKEQDFRSNTQAFIDANSDKVYATFAAFALAQDAVQSEDYAEAEKQLNAALALTVSDDLTAIANLRLARVQIQQQQFDAALQTLATSFPESFKANVEETKGDAYLLQDDKEQARAAYQAAADAGGLQGNPTLQMKLDDLAVTLAQ
ncbi:tetratricopeptide repeat protein [Thalassotalea sp. HSM 43]|uniref:YfgM family protein n=1 Tax=unclassified Thalassotalea TaxID=2614972 RepID=UPI001081BCE8|nr:tetratricopeptide repeat protein [Thalassotalea sp. HSM 43]NMP15960.1 tetratricopeptide repeat protein [Thalassotalea sp. Y01]QBY04986.1 tetratricopeptide repeat protein [Thalassotalea sp. HSM 43]